MRVLTKCLYCLQIYPVVKEDTENREHENNGTIDDRIVGARLDSINSSVQDAGNQTDTTFSYQYETETAASSPESDNASLVENQSNVLDTTVDGKGPEDVAAKHDGNVPATMTEKKGSRDETPDFSGLQLLLNGIEKMEQGSNITDDGNEVNDIPDALSTKNSATAPQSEVSVGDTKTPNSLQILCALADQQFLEEGREIDFEAKESLSPSSSSSSSSASSSSCSTSFAADERKNGKLLQNYSFCEY